MFESQRTQRLAALERMWKRKIRREPLTEHKKSLANVQHMLATSRAQDLELATGRPQNEKPLGVMRLGPTVERVALRNAALAYAKANRDQRQLRTAESAESVPTTVDSAKTTKRQPEGNCSQALGQLPQ